MRRWSSMVAVVFVLALTLSTLTIAQPAQAQATFRCFPSCLLDDARHLAIAGSQFATFIGQSVEVVFAAPVGTTSFNIQIFDGDAGTTFGALDNYWDAPITGRAEVIFELYADPLANGTGMTLLGTHLSQVMPNDDYYNILVATGANAQAPSGNFFYRLIARIDPGSATSRAINTFRYRTDGFLALQPQAWSLLAPLFSQSDGFLIYPNLPDLDLTTYDGTWDFLVDVFNPGTEFVLWDGDFDYGNLNIYQSPLYTDTDDPDTPNTTLPPWAVGGTSFEGVAVGSPSFPGTTGNPPDDWDVVEFWPTDVNLFARLTGAPTQGVIYSLTDPNGLIFENNNPSGNSEWEQFRIATGTFNPATMDYTTQNITPGRWRFRIRGLDLGNQVYLRANHNLLCVNPDNSPCTNILRPYLVGDYVWYDDDGDAVQDPNEKGIPNVLVQLLDSAGNLIATTYTNANGLYQFEVEAGTYSVRIAGENFQAGGPLVGYSFTTPGGSTQTNTVVNTNILTYDFGLRRPPGGQTPPPGTTPVPPVTLPATGYPPAPETNGAAPVAAFLVGLAFVGGAVALRLRRRR